MIKASSEMRVVSEYVSGATREGQEENKEKEEVMPSTCRTFKMMNEET